MNHIKVVFATIIFVCALYYGYLGGRILYNNSHSTAADCHSNANALTIINDNMEQAIAIAKERNCQILLDFWNLGCKNCLAMDATTFKNSNLISIINDNYVFIKINADLPQHQNLLKALNIIGLPTYIVAEPLRNEKENQQ